MMRVKDCPDLGERRFDAVARILPCGLYEYALTADGSPRFIYLNERAEEILEFPSMILLADISRFWDLVHPRDIELFREAHPGTDREEGTRVVDVRVLTQTGKTKWVRFSSCLQPSVAEGAGIRSGFMTDVTELKGMERKAGELETVKREMKALEASNAALEKIVEEKNRLLKKLSLTAKTSGMGAVVAALAHEVGQPLTAIHLATFRALDLWKNRRDEAICDPDRLVTLLDNIDRYQYRVTDLIAGVRQWFRRGARDFEKIDLSELLGDALDITERGLVEAKIALQTDVEPDIVVIGDIGQLQMVLLNLINNACNVLSESNARRRLSVQLKREGRQAIVEISDNGPGLPPGKEDLVFSLRHAEIGDGGGIGLWLSREIVASHGGCLYARNRPSGGARFTLELPS